MRLTKRQILATVVLATAACSAFVAAKPAAAGPEVRIAEGSVRGKASDKGIVFRGIPFAAAPTGALRFAAPAPAAPWAGVREATKNGDKCLQKNLFGITEGSEDCLTLNVFAPKGTTAGSKLPVMVWIHGGSWETGSKDDYDATAMAERQKVIVVVPNYRLGALGFLAHPTLKGAGQGSYGFQDQQAALRWVKTNIHAFGGDPSKVTIFGESAGSISVCLHMVAPGSQGLFTGAIMQSGNCLTDGVRTAQALEPAATKAVQSLGCEGPVTPACLRSAPAKKFVEVKHEWALVVGSETLPRAPEAVFAKGEQAAVPVIAGSNRDEGTFFTTLAAFAGQKFDRKSYDTALAGFATGRESVISQRYESVASRSIPEATARIITDSRFACPLIRLRNAMGTRNAFYAYEFNDPNVPSILPQLPGQPPLGSFHAAEIVYVFNTGSGLSDVNRFDKAQWALARRMQDMWGSFARTGKPSVADAAVWSPFDGRQPYSFAPGANGTVADFPTEHRCDVWNVQ